MAPREYIIQDEPEYLARLKLENFGGVEVPFLHLEFRDFKPSSFKKLLQSWTIFRKTIKGPLFAVSNSNDFDKHKRFVTLLGFKTLKAIECPDGIIRPCYISQDITNG